MIVMKTIEVTPTYREDGASTVKVSSCVDKTISKIIKYNKIYS